MGQVVLLVEGADGTGKSSIAENVSRLSAVPVFKNSDEHRYFLTDPTYFKHAAQYVDTYLFKFLRTTGQSIILDRAWPSEWVYSQVLGRETDPATLKWLDEYCAEMGVKIFLPYRTSYDHLEDYDIIKAKIHEIDRCYEHFQKWTKCQTLRLCTDAMDLSGDSLKVLEFMRGKC